MSNPKKIIWAFLYPKFSLFPDKNHRHTDPATGRAALFPAITAA
jgi:hypothetical protein